jgi:transcriptional regulator with XRE-family HTH domain
MTRQNQGSWERRAELADFLRTRRERFAPGDVGLPARPRRRTPGLRREDVAELTGVSATWYTWLEQGRDIRVSASVLENLARVLRLSADERAHLFQLAGRPLPPTAGAAARVPPVVQTLLAALEPFPAHVRDARWYVLDWNRAEALIAPWDALPPAERHVVWNHFTNPDLRRMADDWEGDARTMLALFRQAVAPHLGDPALATMIGRLRRVSPEFAAWWPAHEVQQLRSRPIRLRHPAVGGLVLERVTLTLEAGPSLTVRTLVALPEEDTPAKLSSLLRTASPR